MAITRNQNIKPPATVTQTEQQATSIFGLTQEVHKSARILNNLSSTLYGDIVQANEAQCDEKEVATANDIVGILHETLRFIGLSENKINFLRLHILG